MRGLLSAWEGYRIVVEEYRQLDDERVLVLVGNKGHAKASRIDIGPLWAGGANLLHIHDGKVTRLVIYLDRDRALADLGLEE
jgi:hypothetical protein